ncbi:hypothetical protein QN277_000509 [Acacia crassicarpa]|uniref:Uncharacterized protein n=1 Tax=Acacia crassicarpa TaxID=499986 RepID=A0AAE1N686_9FABA|nr:hypothetical protein QN277_000509 [Acacia crassicarpa]
MKGVALSSLLFFGFFAGIMVWSSWILTMGSDTTTNDMWSNWAFVAQIVVTSTFLMLILLYNIATNTVLYLYCKAIHGCLLNICCPCYIAPCSTFFFHILLIRKESALMITS